MQTVMVLESDDVILGTDFVTSIRNTNRAWSATVGWQRAQDCISHWVGSRLGNLNFIPGAVKFAVIRCDQLPESFIDHHAE